MEELNICPAPAASSYDRDKYFGSWVDEDGDGEDTRFEVLVEENIGDQTIVLSNNSKYFVNPRWKSPYSGNEFSDPDDLDIEHVVPLKEAWVSGACFWSQTQRIRYNNYLADPNHLIAVEASLNRQKSDQGPEQWLPPKKDFISDYILNWANIKANWGLTANLEEFTFLKKNLGNKMPQLLKPTVCTC